MTVGPTKVNPEMEHHERLEIIHYKSSEQTIFKERKNE